MTLQLCPVLGDHIHSARVGTVLGQRFLLPAETTKPRRQVAVPTPLHLWGWDWREGLCGWPSGLPRLPVPVCLGGLLLLVC